MSYLEVFECIEVGCPLGWSLVLYLLEESIKNTIWLNLNLVEVVEDGMKAGDYAACHVEVSFLLHPVWCKIQVLRIAHFIFISDSVACERNYDSNNWLWQEGKELLIESKDFANAPILREANVLKIISENLRIALKRRPLIVFFILRWILRSIWLHGILVHPQRNVYECIMCVLRRF